MIQLCSSAFCFCFQITLPWKSLFNAKTTVEVDGLHLLIIPSTSVAYDEVREAKLAKDTKQSQLARAEERLAIDEIKRAATDNGEDVPEADKQGSCCTAKENRKVLVLHIRTP